MDWQGVEELARMLDQMDDNMERIMGEAEEGLLYLRETKKPTPTFYIPYDEQIIKGTKVDGGWNRIADL